MRITAWLLAITACAVLGETHGENVPASAPQGTGLTVYDTGISLVRERRVVRLAEGSNLVSFEQIPVSMDVSSVTFSPPATVMGVQTDNLQLRHDLSTIRVALSRYVGGIVTLSTADRQYTGKLLGLNGESRTDSTAALQLSDGSVEMVRWADVQNVNLPNGAKELHAALTLLWQVDSREAQVQNIRMNYVASRINWQAEYDMILNEKGTDAYLSGRVSLENYSGGNFKGAGVRLVSTEQGVESAMTETASEKDATVQEYLYGEGAPSLSSSFDALSPVFSYNVNSRIDLADGEKKYLDYVTLERLPVVQSYVYDGVVFDRFQRNRRNDWNYGTEFRSEVGVYVGFKNEKSTGLGHALAPGRLRLYQRGQTGAIDLLGVQQIDVIEADQEAFLHLGTAKGLSGERERIGYSEIVPLHEYEETFEIRLVNNRDQDVEINVVEHLYRWSNYDIVRADSEYVVKGDDVIEFKPLIKAGGSRAIRYTVRYRW